MQLAFVGYGELGKQLRDFFPQGSNNELVFFDDDLYKQKAPFSFPFVDYQEDNYKHFSCIVALGYKNLELRQKILHNLESKGRIISGFTHPSCFINSSSVIGKGVFIYPMCNIDKDVKIGNGSLLNNNVVLCHNTEIGECCYISPGAVLSGNVTVGDNTFIGAGTLISNNIKIGRNVTIGIGSVITKDISDNLFVIGNPMQFVKELIIK